MRTLSPHFHEAHVLANGVPVELRHIRPDDADELARGFARLSPESRYNRFFGGVTALSPAMLHYLTHVDGRDHVAIVATTRDGDSGEERGLGVARFVRLKEDPTVAEAAITVLDDWQRRGLGHLLALTLGRAARERGVRHFRGQILENNPLVRQLLQDLGADLHPQGGGTFVFDMPLDGGGAAERDYEIDARRLLRAAAEYLVGAVRRIVSPHAG
jgi:GNAT superfamily N-acetyltransferase